MQTAPALQHFRPVCLSTAEGRLADDLDSTRNGRRLSDMCLGWDTATCLDCSELQSISVDLTAMAAGYHLSVLLLSVMCRPPVSGL